MYLLNKCYEIMFYMLILLMEMKIWFTNSSQFLFLVFLNNAFRSKEFNPGVKLAGYT